MNELSRIIDQVSLVRQIPVFRKLNWLELHSISGHCVLNEYKKGDIIYKEGDPPDAFYCLISGRLLAYTTGKEGKKEHVEYIYRGMHFGIISLLTGEEHSLTFEALNDSVILKIEKDDFLNILKQIPKLGITISRSLSRRIKKKEAGSKSIFESTIISVYSSVSGSGSSTYAANLAMSLRKETSKKVIFVNISSTQGSSLRQSECEASPIWKKESVSLKDITDINAQRFDKIACNISDICAINVKIDNSEDSFSSYISKFVSFLASQYHFVVLDLPNHFDEAVIATLTQSDSIHIISPDNKNDLDLVRAMLNRLKDTLKGNFSEENIRILITGLPSYKHNSYKEINRILEYDVYNILPEIKANDLKETLNSDFLEIKTLSDESDYAKVVRKISREIGGVLVGLVLGSGAALGFSHIGVLKVLEEENIPIDIVVGSSIGAVIGGLWVTGKSADNIKSFAREFRTKTLSLKLLDPIISKAGFIAGRSIKRWLKSKMEGKVFYDTKIPFKVVAYDLVRREELVINEGSLINAIIKSIAIPGVIKPIKSGEKLVIDGGIVNPLPANVLTRLGIKKIIAVNVFQSPDDVNRTYDMFQNRLREDLSASFATSPLLYINTRIKALFRKVFYPNMADLIIRSLQAMEYTIAEQSGLQTDVLIHPDLAGIDWFEFYKVDELVKRGKKAARNRISEIKALIEEK